MPAAKKRLTNLRISPPPSCSADLYGRPSHTRGSPRQNPRLGQTQRADRGTLECAQSGRPSLREFGAALQRPFLEQLDDSRVDVTLPANGLGIAQSLRDLLDRIGDRPPRVGVCGRNVLR